MKIFVTHAKSFDFENELYAPLRNSQLAKEHQLIFPEEGERKRTKDSIQECGVVLAEVSYPSTGSGIEIGWANALDKPIIAIYKSGSKISSSLEYVTQAVISYKNIHELPELIAQELKKVGHIKHSE
ncbi:MAG: Uncharacterized protein Greene071421_276 [Parcubacteria group bacterium Greene0714_21]|nr:MAG: Uncharacterized protein Greene041639_588 [Parcubacteria group bacterium Greene0416_39]TSC97602.1 MAG: Uncharacterized protein Greene101447_412 [Parcubacteria group bacterium Greene1014_47]TSD04440.1 MAG: Uncharacterized protein Greene071421_276 [Parcubacteria group bacterium Greene0714_21]